MKKILITFVAFLSAAVLFGQGKYGADSAECIKYLSYYQQYLKQNNFHDAAVNWRKAIKLCPPTANHNMLLDGMKFLRKDINKFKSNPVRKKELIDSLMMLHQMRAETYPRYIVTAKINKAMDMINFVEPGGEMEVYKMIEDAMTSAQGKSPVSIIVRYMKFAVDLYQSGRLGEEDVMKAFELCSSTLEKVNQKKPSEMVNNAIGDIENMFAKSGVANCDNLVAVFGPRYEANPEDKALLSNIVTLFSATDCIDSELFLHAVEGLHKVEPSYNSSYLLFKLYSSNVDGHEKAVKYLNEAIAFPESDAETDAGYYYELATYYFQKLGKNAEAIVAAKQAADLSQTFTARAYMLIGTVWSVTKCSGNEIETRAPFWVATDYMVKAKNLDPSLAEEANKNIANYAKYFPMQSDAFMYNIVDGDSYTVSCGGMRETTRVRTQK